MRIYIRRVWIFLFISLLSCSKFSVPEVSTLSPKATLQPLLSPTISAKIQNTPTPFISPEDREKMLREYFLTESQCKFPCWFEITPGKTTQNEAQVWFQKWGVLYLERKIKDGSVLDLGSLDFSSLMVLNRFEIVFDNTGVVSSINGVLHAYLNQPGFSESWRKIDIEQILLEYGIPTDVLFKMDYNDATERVGYQLGLIYKKDGFAVFYNGAVNFDTVLTICPKLQSYQLITVGLHSQRPDNEMMFNADSDSRNFYLDYPLGKNQEELYEYFVKHDNQCINVPSDVFK